MKNIHCAQGINALIPEHLRDLKVTTALLSEHGACSSGARWFKAKFPEGCLYPELRVKLAEENHQEWENWVCLKFGGDVATAGDRGTATAGYRGTATAGYRGTATAGDRGTATAGYSGAATAGYSGAAASGEEGVISIEYYDSKKEKFRRKVGQVGEDGIKPNVKYRLNAKHQFEEVI